MSAFAPYDTERPCASRMYDYYLGGTCNFAADRAAAEHFIRLSPSAPNAARLNRWFMHDAMARLATAEFDCYLDLASGLPTQEYIHQLKPAARVIYNDIDPVTVAYGQELIGDNPLVRYIQSDAADIETLLRVAGQHFQGQQRVAFTFVGASYFIPDEPLRQIMDRIYDWCAPGSQFAMSWFVIDAVHDKDAADGVERYNKIGASLYLRRQAEIESFFGRWQVCEPGLISLASWLGLSDWRVPGDEQAAHYDLYGVMLQKPEQAA